MVICLSLLRFHVSTLIVICLDYSVFLIFCSYSLWITTLNRYMSRLREEQLKCVLDVKIIWKTDDIESIAGLSGKFSLSQSLNVIRTANELIV